MAVRTFATLIPRPLPPVLPSAAPVNSIVRLQDVALRVSLFHPGPLFQSVPFRGCFEQIQTSSLRLHTIQSGQCRARSRFRAVHQALFTEIASKIFAVLF